MLTKCDRGVKTDHKAVLLIQVRISMQRSIWKEGYRYKRLKR